MVINMKYTILVFCPMSSYGGSTGLAPIHVRIISLLISVHKVALVVGEFFFLFFFLVDRMGSRNTINDPAKATTPPSFDGIDRRIA